MTERDIFAIRVEMLVSDVRAAANPEVYDVDPVGYAVAKAKRAMSEARRLGLYPTTAQIEAELRKAA